MTYYPVFIVLILAVLNWIATDKNWKTLGYVTKPGTMLAMLWWMWQSVGLGGSVLWFTIGLIFCLAGDIFLMLPRDMFIFALLAFLVGHIFYILGLNNTPPFINLRGILFALILRNVLMISTIVILGIYIVWLYPKLARGLSAKGKSKLRIPVLIYSLVISLMVYSAVLTWLRVGWSAAAALSVSLGAVLFYVSDSILAWDRFVNSIAQGRTMSIVSYHLGQIGIIFGAMLYVVLNR